MSNKKGGNSTTKESLKKAINEASEGYKQALELQKVAHKMKQNADEALKNAQQAVENYKLLGKQFIEAYRKLVEEQVSLEEKKPEIPAFEDYPNNPHIIYKKKETKEIH